VEALRPNGQRGRSGLRVRSDGYASGGACGLAGGGAFAALTVAVDLCVGRPLGACRVPDASRVPGLHETVLEVRMDVEQLEEHRGQPGDDDRQDPHVERDGQQQEGQGDGNRELDE